MSTQVNRLGQPDGLPGPSWRPRPSPRPMPRHAFDEPGYRRYEWKCDALNAWSRQAADRLGFRFEGIFRQAVVYKGRNRDTAWYSILDREWPALKQAFERWLAPGNFDGEGCQRESLS